MRINIVEECKNTHSNHRVLTSLSEIFTKSLEAKQVNKQNQEYFFKFPGVLLISIICFECLREKPPTDFSML